MISNLDIGIVKYHYFLVSAFSFIFGFLIYAKHVRGEKSKTESQTEKWIRRISLLFPFHFSFLGFAGKVVERIMTSTLKSQKELT